MPRSRRAHCFCTETVLVEGFHKHVFGSAVAGSLRWDGLMNEPDAAADASALVPGAHRLIRVLGNGEGPFAGDLVSYGDSVAVCADAASLAGWDGWRLSGSEHVAGALDLRRRTDGQDVLLPWCTESVSVFLGRRRAAEDPLSAGEIGTLVASALRGLREAGDAAVEGQWWLSHDGCPLFVFDTDATAKDSARSRGIGEATGALVTQIEAGVTDRQLKRLLAEISAGLERARIPLADEQRWETELFAVAAPRALRTDLFVPERARALDPNGELRGRVTGDGWSERVTRRERRAVLKRPAVLDRRRSVPELLGGATTAIGDWRGRFTRETRRDIKRLKDVKTGTPRRRSMLVAGAAAVAVLAGGLMWPTGSTDESLSAAGSEIRATERPTSSEPTKDPEPVASSDPAADSAAPDDTESDETTTDAPSQDPQTHDGAEGDALNAAPGLLEAIVACRASEDAVCASALVPGAHLPEDGAAVGGSEASTATLVDDYGDIAVIRLTPVDAGETEQMLVLVRQNELWLVRDVYDVANQPE